MQHAIPYLHETFEGLPLPMYSKTDEPSFEDVFKFVKEITSFIVDLTKLDNITDVTGNDGEKMEHHSKQLLLTLSWRWSQSHKNQSTDLQSKSIDWFIYDKDLHHEKVKGRQNFCRQTNFQDQITIARINLFI